MNIVLMIHSLEDAFSEYTVHSDLIKDLISILKNSGNEKSFIAKLTTSLWFLSEYGKTAHLQPTKQFEKIKDVDNMYSMHICTKNYNVRILYSFLSDDKILLHGFDEKSGKRITDYSHALPVAKNRLNEIIEEELL